MNDDNFQKNSEENSLYEKESNVDILNEELYYKNKEFKQRKRRKIHERSIAIKHNFEESEEYNKLLKKNKARKLPTSLFKKIFFSALFFFIITAIIAVVSLYEKKGGVSNDLISMDVLGQPFIDGGEELKLRVRIQNFNKQDLELPDLVLSYPKDSSSSEDDVFLRRSLPNIGPGQRVDEEFGLTIFGKEGDVRNIHVHLEYRIKGSTSIFLKEMNHELIIRSTPTKLSVSGPDDVTQGQEIQVDIKFASNSNQDLHNMLIDVDYPLGFEFISSNVEPEFGSNVWYLSSIPREEKTISIKGKLSALPGQSQSFHVRMGKQNISQKNLIETVFNEVTYTVEIKEAFLTTQISVNGQKGSRAVIRGGGEADVYIQFENTLDRTLNNVNVVAHLIGDLYKPDGVRSLKGDYDSNRKIITWNKDNVVGLDAVDPGESNSVGFNVKTKDLVGPSESFIKPNFAIVVDISGVDVNGLVREAKSIARVDVVANTDLNLIARTLYSEGPFKNLGPIPPRVGKITRYTITLQVTNSSNDVEGAQVVTFLPPYVSWVGEIYPSSEKDMISYNNTTREIKWNIGEIKHGIGIGTSYPKQVSFQVDLLPSLSHVDTLPKLTRDIILSGTDTFTGTDLSYKKTALTTKLLEASASTGDSRVVN